MSSISPAKKRDWVYRLGSSTFNYWFGYVSNGILVMLLAINALLFAQPWGGWWLVGCFFCGLVLWTLAEYLLHKYVYHVWPSVLRTGHLFHHQEPKGLIGVPWYLTAIGLLVIYGLVVTVAPAALVGSLLAGFWLGYIGYCVVHHGTHHWRSTNPLIRAAKRRHYLHHRFTKHNFGVTTAWWDHIFGTYLATGRDRD